MLKFGKQVFKLNSVDSTNNYAANLLKDGLIENGAVVMADFQTNGRGQRSNVWHSDSGMNLCASFVYLPVVQFLYVLDRTEFLDIFLNQTN